MDFYPMTPPKVGTKGRPLWEYLQKFLPVKKIVTRQEIASICDLGMQSLPCRLDHPFYGRGSFMSWLERLGGGKYCLREKPLKKSNYLWPLRPQLNGQPY